MPIPIKIQLDTEYEKTVNYYVINTSFTNFYDNEKESINVCEVT